MKPKVVFVKNRFVDYTIPWFREINKSLDLKLIYTQDNKNQKVQDLNIEYLSHFKLFNKYSVSFSLIKKLLSEKYDILVSSDPHTFETIVAFIISKLRGKKYLLWNETFEWPRSSKSNLIQPIVNYIIKNSDATMAVGVKSKEYLEKRNTKKIFITPYASLTFPAKHNSFNIPKNKQIILYFGRLVRYKGLDYLIKAFAKLEETRNDVFLLIGTNGGPFEQEIKLLISTLGIKNYKFVNPKTDDEKGSLYNSADIFVLPSTFRDYDADCWGLVLNEAMALGKPVISTYSTGAAYDLIKQEVNGYILEQKNSEALYNALNKILSNKKLKEKMGKESKKIIETKHNYKKMAQGFVDAIKYVTSS